MAVNYSGMYGGGSSKNKYAGMFGTGGYAAGASKDPKPSGVGGFFQNLGSDIRALTGIPAGLKAVGSAALHDAGKAVGLSSGPFELDDIGRAIASDYKHTYGPLFSGEFKKFGGRLYAHPLAPILDAATVVTGGAALAGKTSAKIAATTGSTRAMKIAGLRRVTEITPSSIRPISGPAGNFVAATRPIVDPITGNTLYEKPVVRNPVIRARKELLETAYSKLPSSSYMSPTRRGVRLAEAEPRRIARRKAATVERAYMSAFKRLSKDERDALVYISQGFNTVERAGILRQQRLNRARELSQTAKEGVERAKEGADAGDLIRDARVIERVMPLIENPTPALQAAFKQQQALDNIVQGQYARNLTREGKTPEEADAIIMERSQGPLVAVGIEPGMERPIILTHVADPDSLAKRNKSLERGLTTKILDEEKATGFSNFLNARYTRDPSIALTTHRIMFAKEETFNRMERALASADVYDHAKHQHLINEGKLTLIDRNSKIVDDIKYVDDSLDRMEADIGDFTDVEMDALRETYRAMHDLILKEGAPGVVLPTPHYAELVGQFKGARGILEKITDGLGVLTKPWRHIVLSLKGSFYVNNFIGNLFLGMVAYGPRFVLDTAQESMPAALRGRVSQSISEGVSDLERTAGARNIADASRTHRLNIISRLGEKVSSKGVLLTEDNFRRAGFRVNLRRKVDEYRATQPGMTRHEAVEAIMNDRNAVDQLAEATYGDLLDYSKLTPFEKELLLPAMPFWNFTRAMTGRTIRMTLDEPWKMRVLLYFGESGLEANEDALPSDLELPEYLKGLILLDPTGDLPRVLSTYGMNPFVAPVDMAMQIGGVFGKTEGSMNPLASFNPFLKAPLEAVFNKDVFYGGEIRAADGTYPDSFGGRLSVQMQKNIPQVAMLQRYRYPSKYPSVERDAGDTLLQYAGLPVGNLNPANIERVNQIVAAMKASEQASRERQAVDARERARF
jgi:hypothetical protein